MGTYIVSASYNPHIHITHTVIIHREVPDDVPAHGRHLLVLTQLHNLSSPVRHVLAHKTLNSEQMMQGNGHNIRNSFSTFSTCLICEYEPSLLLFTSLHFSPLELFSMSSHAIFSNTPLVTVTQPDHITNNLILSSQPYCRAWLPPAPW